jgi:hypothetical protein
MPPAADVLAHRLAAAHQIPQRLLRCVGHMDDRQLARPEQPHELARIAAVGLDPLARPPRGQRWRHHRTPRPQADHAAIEVVARHARLVAHADLVPLGLEPPDQAAQRLLGIRDLAQLRVVLARAQNADHELELAVIEGHVRSTLLHDRPPHRLRLCPSRGNNPRSCDQAGRSFHIVLARATCSPGGRSGREAEPPSGLQTSRRRCH